jgi:hypothetical protein
MDIETILGSEYSEKFDELRKNRVVASFFKYGPAKENFGQGLVDPIESAKMCMREYDKSLNTEYLTDAANYLMFAFMFPAEGAYFRATDSKESAGKAGMSINEIKNYGKV